MNGGRLRRRLSSTCGCADGSSGLRSMLSGVGPDGLGAEEEKCAEELFRHRDLSVLPLSMGSTYATVGSRTCPANTMLPRVIIRQNHQTGERSLDFLKW